MAVLVEALSVVVRRDAIARRYEGGWPGFVASVPNGTLCADSEIARLGFMHPDNVAAFLKRLEGSGFVFLNQTGTAVDIVVVDQREGPTTPCDWIEFFRQEVSGGTVSAARLTGSQDKTLFCPDGWDFEHSLSRNSQFIPGRKFDQNYEFVGRERGQDVFRDRRTNQKVYLNRPSYLFDPEEEAPTQSVEEIRQKHDSLLQEAIELLTPYLAPSTLLKTAADAAKVARACEALEQVISLMPNKWNAWWGLGMARRLLQDREGAYAAFARAYRLNPNEIEVGRNLISECITLGYAQEAIEVTAAMVRLAPEDAGLIANHALARLIGGDLEGALREATRALEKKPGDEITLNLCQFINDVREGRVPAPSRMPTW